MNLKNQQEFKENFKQIKKSSSQRYINPLEKPKYIRKES